VTWPDGDLGLPRITVWEVLRAPWSGRTWRATAHLVTGGLVALLTGGTILLVGIAVLATAISVVVIPLGLMVLLPAVRWATATQRSRFAAFLDLEIPPVPRAPGRTWPRRMIAEARAPRTWRQVGFHLLSLVQETASALVVAVVWTGGLLLTTVLLYGEALREAVGTELLPEYSPYIGDLTNIKSQVALTLAGVLVLHVAPWVARGLAALDAAAALTLLGPNRAEELTHRVETLSESRAAVLAAADAERRRIERDLHDGLQQRLVSLAMNLGMTRAMAADLPPAARDAIAEHHEEAKQALTELRDFVRGLHPAVLNDRGLDAALTGIAARSPLPVTLRVELPSRLDPAVEAVAYFVVSEALANAAKHARAGQAEVTVERHQDLIRVAIRDDGVGGARADAGTGLRGLTQRVASVDGTLHIQSPDGGPTEITVELPCE
jgi:signal transduction histidine kinase